MRFAMSYVCQCKNCYALVNVLSLKFMDSWKEESTFWTKFSVVKSQLCHNWFRWKMCKIKMFCCMSGLWIHTVLPSGSWIVPFLKWNFWGNTLSYLVFYSEMQFKVCVGPKRTFWFPSRPLHSWVWEQLVHYICWDVYTLCLIRSFQYLMV